MQITAIVKRIEETQSAGSNGFEFRNLVVTTEEQYVQTLEIKFTQGRVVLLDNFQVKDRVKISYNLKGREVVKDGKTTVFNSIEGWKIEKIS